MLKNKILIFIFMLLVLATSFAQTHTDSLYQAQQSQVLAIEQKMQVMETECREMSEQNVAFSERLKNLEKLASSLENENRLLNNMVEQNQQEIDALSSEIAHVQSNSERIGNEVDSTKRGLQQNATDLRAKSLWGIIAVVFALLVSIVVALSLHKKGQKLSKDNIDEMKRQTDEINEKVVNRFDSEMNELQRIINTLTNFNNANATEPDHSLVKVLADRITFMEMTLYRMDPQVRGYRQLSRSISQMKDNLFANGYEIVEMLGKDYDEGMRVTANFVEDENLEPGRQVITGITKPQINYQGVMIQAAQVTVSQN